MRRATYGEAFDDALYWTSQIWGDRPGRASWAMEPSAEERARLSGSSDATRAEYVVPQLRYDLIERSLQRRFTHDVYVGPQLQAADPDADPVILGGPWVWVEVDGATASAQEDRLAVFIEDRASIVVDIGGGGVQLYLRVEAGLPAHEIRWWSRRLAEHLNSNDVASRNSLVRLPGTCNHSYADANGCPAPVVLVERYESGSWDLDELDRHLLPRSVPAAARLGGSGDHPASPSPSGFDAIAHPSRTTPTKERRLSLRRAQRRAR